MPGEGGATGSWIQHVWRARELGLLSGDEAWDVVLAAREAPDPAATVAFVLRGLEAVKQPPPTLLVAPDVVVITDL